MENLNETRCDLEALFNLFISEKKKRRKRSDINNAKKRKKKNERNSCIHAILSTFQRREKEDTFYRGVYVFIIYHVLSIFPINVDR